MEVKPMKILIIEDDINDCNKLIDCAKTRSDIEIVAVTDSDIEGLRYVKALKPEGIILDIELNNSKSGNTDSLNFMTDLKDLKLNYEPIVIVTTHVNSKRTYDVLHRNGVDLILYKDNKQYSANYIFNHFINFRNNVLNEESKVSIEETLKDEKAKISSCINKELANVGITSKLKGKTYIFDAIMYLIENENDGSNIVTYLSNLHKKSATTITNGIQNAIYHAWRVTPLEDLTKYYTARVNYETGVPTPMEFIYYYKDKIKDMI